MRSAVGSSSDENQIEECTSKQHGVAFGGSDRRASLVATHLVYFGELFGDVFEFLQNFSLLLPLLLDQQLVQIAHLFGSPTGYLGPGALDIGDELDVFFEELVFVAEAV